jgi:tRNA-(ms[2]io[6]A)-hydroxylase
MKRGGDRTELLDTLADLPLVWETPRGWAELAAANLPEFLADHAVCEQQAALTALNLVSHYPGDAELVDRMTALAAEEILHLRRVTGLLHRRGLQSSRRRGNPYVQALRAHIQKEREDVLKVDRLIVGALIEARSCERFTRLLEAVGDRDEQVVGLLLDLGPAEKRHWELFHRLAAREVEGEWFADHWQGWLRYEGDVCARGGVRPTVHG